MLSKKIRSAIALVLLLAVLLPFFPTTVSAAYENTYQNTGNMRDDIIGVALTQVGYHEGSNNYTKYGVWYGLPNSPWCGMFVSWCAAQAGIPTSVLKRTGIANPSNFGLSYKSGSEYTPQKGDLFFKKSFSHVGLVYYTEGAYFYTIEGNTSDVSSEGTSVLIRRRKISDFYFSTPNYSGSGSSSSGGCSHSYSTGYEAAHPHKEYQSCSKCGKTSYTGNATTSSSCTTCIQAACDHSFGSWFASDNGKHARTCSKCNFTEANTHDWETSKVLKEATCVDEGSKQLICSVCQVESTEAIPVTNEHTYGTTSYIDESVHQMVCSVCSRQETFAHTPSGNWKNDTLYHWTSCADCGGRLMHTEHTFSGGCLLPCDTCGYTLDTGHKLGEDFQYDGDVHWQVCLKCGLNADAQLHIYSSECDESCNDCGYVRSTTTEHTDEFQADESGHSRVCTACQRTTPHIQHTADRNSEEWEDTVCIQCQFVLRSSERHEHILHEIDYDNNTHWGSCICGETMQPEVHTWDVKTGVCSMCNAAYTTNANKGNFLTRILKNLFTN